MVELVTKNSFDDKVMQSDKPVVVDFFADWCGPCKRLAPIFAELSSELTDMSFVKVDIEEDGELAGSFGVQSIPTLIVFKNGQAVDRIMGLMPKDQLKTALEQYI